MKKTENVGSVEKITQAEWLNQNFKEAVNHIIEIHKRVKLKSGDELLLLKKESGWGIAIYNPKFKKELRWEQFADKKNANYWFDIFVYSDGSVDDEDFAKGGSVMSDGKFKLRGFPPIDKVELRGLYNDFKENFSSKIESFTKHLNKVHNSKLRLIDIKQLMDYAKMNFVSKGGMVEYHDYKGVEIMYEPTYEEYFVNDEVFNSMESAKRHIDYMEKSNGVIIDYYNGYDINIYPKLNEYWVNDEIKFNSMEDAKNYIDTGEGRGAMAKGGSVDSKAEKLANRIRKDYQNGVVVQVNNDFGDSAYFSISAPFEYSLSKERAKEINKEYFNGEGSISGSGNDHFLNVTFYLDNFAKGGSVKNGYMVFNYTDNLYATNEIFQTKNDAKRFIDEFKKRFVLQGYYRDSNMNKIDINDVDLYVLDADFNPYKFSEGGIVTYPNLDLNTNRNIIAKAIEFISGTGVDAESMTLEGKEIRFKYRTSNTYTTISQKLISDTISTNRKSLELRGKNFATGGMIKGGIVLASSSTKEGIIKLIVEYLYGSTITLVETDNDKIYEVHNKKGKTSFYVEFSRGKYRFIQPSMFANGGEIQVGNKFGDWSITQYKPIVYEEIGGTRDGLIKLVNQDTFEVILVQYDGMLRNPKWYARSNGIYVEGKSPKEVIEKLKFATGGMFKDGGGIADDNKNKLWYEVLQKFFKIFYGEYEDDTAEKHIKDSQVTTDQAKYYYENFMSKYKTERSLSDGFKIFKQSLTKEELDSIQISFNSEDYADAEEHDTQKRYSTITIKKKENFKKGGSVVSKENSIKEFFKKFGFNVEDIQKDEYSNGIEGWIVFYDNKNKYRVIDYSVAMYLIVHDKTTNKTDIIKQSKSFNIDNFATGGDIENEQVYIDYMNKEKGFKRDRIYFDSYAEAVEWGRKNFERFNTDMINYV